jgi:hypothetical protein
LNMWTDKNYLWNDLNCLDHLCSMCEIDLWATECAYEETIKQLRYAYIVWKRLKKISTLSQ